MDHFFWRSIVTPIVVAVVGTLLVEYLAKPRLEARKVRLLQNRAAVDAFTLAMQRVGQLAGALPSDDFLARNPRLHEFAKSAISELDAATDAASRALSGLGLPYVVKHRSHIGRTAMYLGYLRGRCFIAGEKPLGNITMLKSAYEELEKFDKYYQVHLGFKDSQRRWLPRVLWRWTKQRKYVDESSQFLAELGLEPPSPKPPEE
ncbi:hypothetical protein I8D64_01720 [Brachybacterium sp. MASK1Z-5]|uniref:DUF4760 domain-containing protein n=1 Tax=Brachybacterium halotolerans TaxID=2795215 RepID=A0ABS1B641_9MICO|nr:hypothetical protein [Brachybacterium halotolerans]MBK0330121.1 hypothetical protein [Brachybacterium halotolerans]